MVKARASTGSTHQEVFMFLHQPLALALGVFIAATPATADQTFDSDNGRVQLETVAEGLEHPWSLAFLPDGSQLVTERAGRLRVDRKSTRLNSSHVRISY